MIKFWKSAAKGKSGCPVRPPEVNELPNTAKYTLDTQIGDENEDYTTIFKKQSILCLSLSDVLLKKIGVKFFMQYMEAIGKHWLVNSWLEMEHFKLLMKSTTGNDPHTKVVRAKSFDLSGQKCQENPSTSFTWSKLNEKFKNNMKSRPNQCSASCANLNDTKDELHKLNLDLSGDSNLTETAVYIFKKYVALEAPYALELADDLRKMIISNICHPEGEIKEDCFQPVQDAVFFQLENNYFHDFQNSPLYMKAQIEVLTNCSLTLNDILYNDAILFYFTEYLEQESCSILLEFLMAVMNIRDNLLNGNTNTPEQAQADAIVLYDKYFSLQATQPIGFSSEIRLKIESDICTEGGPPPFCFDLAYRIVYKTLCKYVSTFLDSELYYKYLSEMIHSVDLTWLSNRKSQSDCSSEFSVSTQNTLLAMGDSGFSRKKRNYSVPDMTIDSNQLYNADSLWQRKKSDGLSLGRVNSLGRFESKLEPDPDKKEKSVLKRIVSRFVPTNAKVDEEMAWQIAHMIVKNVTDLTMAPPENDNEHQSN